MIIEIPSSDDFNQEGLSILNLSWDTIATLYFNLTNAEVEAWDNDGEVTEEYWQSAQRPISISLALAQQGIELLLKGKIAEVSPYLLLAGSPREWPSGCTENNIPFADFRTIDAHELIRAHDAVTTEKLSQSFKNEFERLRRLRNIIFHGVAKKNRPTAEDVFQVILEAAQNLVQSKTWIKIRRNYLENTPESIAYSPDHVEAQIIIEVENIIKILKPAEAKRLLGFNKKHRGYICYECAINSGDHSLQPKIAQLSPNSPDSTELYCLVCDKYHQVIRKECHHADCPGNVLDAEDHICLTCYS